MNNIRSYKCLKAEAFNESDENFISYLLSCEEDSLIRIVKGLQTDVYADFDFFAKFKNRILRLIKVEHSLLFPVFNILYCFKVDCLETNLYYIVDNFVGYHSLLTALFPGAIRNHPIAVHSLANHPSFKSSNKNKLLLEKFLLARGYSFSKVSEILGSYQLINKSYEDREKIKVALLVSGQTRGVEAALKSWQTVFNFSDVELDVFVSTWKLSCQPKEVIWSRVGTKDISKRIKNLSTEMTNEEILSLLSNYLPPKILDESYIANLFNKYLLIHNIDIELESEEEHSNFTNPMKLYYKLHRAFEMSKRHGVYDLYIRIRPDLHLSRDSTINLNELNNVLMKERCIFTHYPYVFEYYGFGVDDKIAIGKFDCMQIYSNTWVFDGNNPNALGHVNLANNLAYHQVNCRKIEGLEVSFSNYNILDISQIENEFNKID